MEKRTGSTTIQKVLTPHSQLPEEVKWENFDPSKVTLTEEEKELALRIGLEKKIAEIKEILWYEKANRKNETQILNPDQVLHIASKNVCASVEKLSMMEFVNSEDFEIYQILSLYFSRNEKFEELAEEFSLNKGLVICGKVGCGKTTALNSFRTIASITFPLISCNKVANDYKKDGVSALEKYINFNSICFDDLGTETSTKNFGDEKNVMTEIILGRYEKEVGRGFKTHITTNLSADQIEDFYGTRVRSRMREMFNSIDFPEGSTDKRK